MRENSRKQKFHRFRNSIKEFHHLHSLIKGRNKFFFKKFRVDDDPKGIFDKTYRPSSKR